MFRKEINPYTVSCKSVFRNVDKTLVLYVRSNAPTMMVNLKKAQEKLSAITGNSTDEERMNAAVFFARAIFGNVQGDQLVDFYEDPMAIIAACGMCFDQQVKKAITKAQKK